MKRAPDKIKDFVEPQPFDEVQSYTKEPARTLAAYRFTDATADLLGRWLDALADLPRARGAARALAGLRGVGKSHALAVFSALATLPDLRANVTDVHVGTSARRLLGRRYTVLHVERGTLPTLMEEMAAALNQTFGPSAIECLDDPSRMLALAAEMSETPLVVVIDTAPGRASRVARNDGPVLSELARATEYVNVFLALALDDDIAGADGANVALSGAYQIDYLDPEHIYRVADTYLFRKSPQARASLHDFYLSLRASVPDFNWSEPRFAAIYPVHPIIGDVAHAVRLYAPTFAFLPFAAGAVARATNRPALSLVLLDEVFDRAEYDLRKADELKAAFSAYDELSGHAVPKLPIMQRLQAKLILKGLFILSLDGRGATARELGAAMLLYDESAEAGALSGQIEQTLEFFASRAPQGALLSSQDGSETRYCFTTGSAAALDAALAEATAQLKEDDAEIGGLLRRVARARFKDWPLGITEDIAKEEADFALVWRGTERLGRIKWRGPQSGGAHEDSSSFEGQATLDWELQMLAPESSGAAGEGSANSLVRQDALQQVSPGAIVWQPARLSADELESLRRLITLRGDERYLSDFGETARAAERTHTALAERIWSRIYIDDGLLWMGSEARAFTDEARASATLAQALQDMLSPLLEARYPQHPRFTETLGETEVAELVGGLFGGANQAEARVQGLARALAEPLGLVAVRGGIYTLETGDHALKQHWVREIVALTERADGEVVPLAEINKRLRREPLGLLRDAQHLVLAALVAQRRIELVTANGDRISRRTLDRALRWDEIAGVARAASIHHSSEELTAWARLLTGEEKLSSIVEPEAREAVRVALAGWLKRWREERILEKFDALPDDGLTTGAWVRASGVRKSFGAAADSIEAMLADDIPLEEGLQRVTDAFGDSEESFARHQTQLSELTCFTEGLKERERAYTYLSTAEPTAEEVLESARRELLEIADNVHNFFDRDLTERFSLLWREFHTHYSAHYAAEHDRAALGATERQAIEELVRGQEWGEFAALSRLSFVQGRYWEEANALLTRARSEQCRLPIRSLLAERPGCCCSFRMFQAVERESCSEALLDVLVDGREAHARRLKMLAHHLSPALDRIAVHEKDVETGRRAQVLAESLARETLPASFSWPEVRLIERALEQPAESSEPLPEPIAESSDVLLETEAQEDEPEILEGEARPQQQEQWLDNLPNNPVPLDVLGESGRNAD